jgi:hypothetical protein
MAPSGKSLPPFTLKEADALIDEIAKARLIERLAGPANGNDVTPDGDSDAASQVDLHDRPTNDERPYRTRHTRDKRECLCSYCNPEKLISDIQHEDPRTMHRFQQFIDDRAARALAALDGVQIYHRDDKRLPDTSEWLEWYAQLFAAVITISSLGAGFTFTILFSGIEVPDRVENAMYSDDQQKANAEARIVRYIRNCLAVSWMLFVFAIGTTTFIALMINTVKAYFVRNVREVEQADGRWGKKPLLLTISCSTLLIKELPVAAFLASSEALRQYNQGVGILSLTGTGVAGFIVGVAWTWQNL